MAYYLKNLPFTEEGRKLNLTNEEREQFRLVYRKEGQDWKLYDIFEESSEYGDDCIVVPMESVYNGGVVLEAGQDFANVIGSTHDPKPRGFQSWIDLWRAAFRERYGMLLPNECCTDGMLYGVVPQQNFMCQRDPAIGGHVILGRNPQVVAVGGNAYIVPICHRHNAQNIGFMRTNQRTFAVRLAFYFQAAYFAQHPLETHEKI